MNCNYQITFLFFMFLIFSPGMTLAENKVIEVSEKEYVMTLHEVSELALHNNFDIQLAKYDTYIARTRQAVSESIFDTVINADIEYQNDRSQQLISTAASKTVDNDYNIGLSKKFSSGSTVSADLTNNRMWSDSSAITSNPNHSTAFGVTFVQELGKNYFGVQDRRDITLTKIEIKNSRFTSLNKIESSLAASQVAYWDLVLAREKVLIEKDMLAQAKKLYDLNNDKLKHGLVEKPDVLASEANYKMRSNQLKLAENDMATKENILRLYLNISHDSVNLVPSDKFDVTGGNIEVDDSLRSAFKNRYDYKEKLNVIESKDITILIKDNNTWPEVNLTATLSRNGIDDKFNQAYSKMFNEDNSTFFAGLSVSVPVENNKAKAELKAAELEKAKVLISLKLLERKIMIDIIDQVRLCNVLREVAISNDEISFLQAEKLKAEESRFNTGRSDTDTIIRFQEDVSRARWVAAQSKFQYHVANIDLQTKESSLLSKYWDGNF